MTASHRLSVTRRIAASPARLFAAWTDPAQLRAWWGPADVRCTHAEVDARVGGRYRLENVLDDASVIVITGEFLLVDPPNELVYTWEVQPGPANLEQVTVRFLARGAETEVSILHERIESEEIRDRHTAGWLGCLDGLATHVGSSAATRRLLRRPDRT